MINEFTVILKKVENSKIEMCLDIMGTAALMNGTLNITANDFQTFEQNSFSICGTQASVNLVTILF